MTRTNPAEVAKNDDPSTSQAQAPPKGDRTRAAGETRWAQASGSRLLSLIHI